MMTTLIKINGKIIKLLFLKYKSQKYSNAQHKEEWHSDAPFLLGDGTGQRVDAAWVIGCAGQVAA